MLEKIILAALGFWTAIGSTLTIFVQFLTVCEARLIFKCFNSSFRQRLLLLLTKIFTATTAVLTLVAEDGGVLRCRYVVFSVMVGCGDDGGRDCGRGSCLLHRRNARHQVPVVETNVALLQRLQLQVQALELLLGNGENRRYYIMIEKFME